MLVYVAVGIFGTALVLAAAAICLTLAEYAPRIRQVISGGRMPITTRKIRVSAHSARRVPQTSVRSRSETTAFDAPVIQAA